MVGIRSLKKIFPEGRPRECLQLELTETLCHVRLEIARCNTTRDYQVEEVQNAVKELKLGKYVDPAGLIRDVYIRGGSGLTLLQLCSMHLRKTLMLLGSEMRYIILKEKFLEEIG